MRAARGWLLALLLCCGFAAFALPALAQVAVPPLTGRVVDQTGTLSADALTRLEQKLREFEARKGSQIAVLIVPTTAPEAIEQYSLRVAEAWKIGRKKVDDGAILVIAKNDRKLRIEVGYGLEGALTDVAAKRIISEIISPKFKNGDFSGGIEDGVARMIRVIDGETLPKPEPEHEWHDGAFDAGLLFNPFVIIAAIVLSGILRGMFGRLLGSVATGGLVGLIAWVLIASAIAAGIAGVIAFFFTLLTSGVASGNSGRGGGWSSGGWSGGGGSWSSGSGGGGGFSGGGGDFGGGGASGDW